MTGEPDVSGLSQQIDELKQELLHQQIDLDRSESSIIQAQAAQTEAIERRKLIN